MSRTIQPNSSSGRTAKKSISDDELFRNGNCYRLHQDNLRWTLLAGYAAFFIGIVSIKDKTTVILTISMIAGNCYFIILGVENFFYNLFSEYVKDCETRRDEGRSLRSLRQFSENESPRVGPFHHSFFFALLMVLFGNLGITWHYECNTMKYGLSFVNICVFLAVFFGWDFLVYPYVVTPFQRLFDISDKQRNIVWRVFNRLGRSA